MMDETHGLMIDIRWKVAEGWLNIVERSYDDVGIVPFAILQCRGRVNNGEQTEDLLDAILTLDQWDMGEVGDA